MAKAATRRKRATPARSGSKVVDYAEELGRLLGTVRSRIDGMVVERRKLAQQLNTVVKDAQGLLTELGQQAKAQVSRLTAASRRPPKRRRTKQAKRRKKSEI